MHADIVQLDLFIKDMKELEKHQKEEKDRKMNKQVRFVMHKATELAKEMQKEKTA